MHHNMCCLCAMNRAEEAAQRRARLWHEPKTKNVYGADLPFAFRLESIIYAPFAMLTTFFLWLVTSQIDADLVKNLKNVHGAKKLRRKSVSAKKIGLIHCTRHAVIVVKKLPRVLCENASRPSHRVCICATIFPKKSLFVTAILISACDLRPALVHDRTSSGYRRGMSG